MCVLHTTETSSTLLEEQEQKLCHLHILPFVLILILCLGDQFKADVFSTNRIQRIEHWSSPLHEGEGKTTFAQAEEYGKELEGYYEKKLDRSFPEFQTGTSAVNYKVAYQVFLLVSPCKCGMFHN
jgi:hypothetical protein